VLSLSQFSFQRRTPEVPPGNPITGVAGLSHFREDIMPSWLISLFESGAVWAALIALMNILVKYFLPNLPAEILAAVNVLVLAILAALGINVNQRIRAARDAQKS